MEMFDLLMDGPFPALDIPAPERLETTDDKAALMQHLVSVYRVMLNLMYQRQGQDARQHTLTMIVLFLSEIMPDCYPECVSNYPESLDEIYRLVGGMIAPETEREAG